MASVICDKPYTSADKWTSSFMVGILFLLISSPLMYQLTNAVTSSLGLVIASSKGCPNLVGLALHTIVFIVILRLLMNKNNTSGCDTPYSSRDKWMVSLIGGLLFLLVSSPFLYEAVDSILQPTTGLNIANRGCPTTGGLVVHAVVYSLLTRLLMR